MPGIVLRIECKEGQTVKQNQLVMVMEAMKMENEIYAPCDGVIGKIAVTQGQQVSAGDTLVTMGTAAAPAAAAAVKLKSKKKFKLRYCKIFLNRLLKNTNQFIKN